MLEGRSRQFTWKSLGPLFLWPLFLVGCDERQGGDAASAPAAAVVVAPPEPEPEVLPVDPAVESVPTAQRVTFNRDIAPILFSQCASCHRAGEAGPFPLLTYQDARKRARLLARVTESRYMPPWLPEPGHVALKNERRLSDRQIRLMGDWIKAGAPEGDAADLPPLPTFAAGWQLGEPDLVVKMPEGFTVPAEGTDVYRNFVIPVPLGGPRYVKAMELRPGNPRVLHHAFLWGDSVHEARRLDRRDAPIGYGGIDPGTGARALGGRLNAWNPGLSPRPPEPGISFRLSRDTDIVLQTHLRPTGRREAFSASVGLHFTDEPPIRTPTPIWLFSYRIDIPAGASAHVIEDRFVLPVDVELRTIKPHAHYLCHEVIGTATLPDGKTQTLLHIRNWNFDWQEAYLLAEPLSLPRGTTLSMRYTFDNSTGNVRNPHQPPQRVRFGPNSSDEMAELHLELMTRSREDQAVLVQAQQRKMNYGMMELCQTRIAENPNDAASHDSLGRTMRSLGYMNEARRSLENAVRLAPTEAEFRDHLGVLLFEQGETERAEAEFKEAVRLDPSHPRALNRLGGLALARRDFAGARTYFESAAKVTPGDAIILMNLGLVAAESGDVNSALVYLQQATEADPEYIPARDHLQRVQGMRQRAVGAE